MSEPTHIVILPETEDREIHLVQLSEPDQTGFGIWQIRDGLSSLGHIVGQPEAFEELREALRFRAAARGMASATGRPVVRSLSGSDPAPAAANVAQNVSETPNSGSASDRYHDHMAECSVCRNARIQQELCDLGAILRAAAFAEAR